jgi:hypothetical protein
VFDAAVVAGIAAFLQGESPPDDADVYTTLTRRGVEPWLAERLLVFLPVAFGRVLLGAVTASADFVDGEVTRPLAGDPVFQAATARAATANRDEVRRIGLRSSEVTAVNEALNAGSAAADLELLPLTLPQPLPPMGTGNGGVPSVREAFAGLLREHGFAVDGSRVGALEFDAQVFPRPPGRQLMVQVDFVVRHPALARDRIVESFAGVGATWQDALGQTVRKFGQGSLHPILAVLLDRSAGADQVEWERLSHPGGAFDVCLGPLLGLYSATPPAPIGPLLAALLAALGGVPLSRTVHSLRVFTMHQDRTPMTAEVLLDNQPWAAGQAIVAAARYEGPPGLVGSRLFALLTPAA